MRSTNQSPPKPPGPAMARPAAKVGLPTLIAVIIILGIATGTVWYFRSDRTPPAANDASEAVIHLSDNTRIALKRLRSPVEIHFYSVLGKAGADGELQAFAGRVDRLLSAYEREADGKIEVKRYNSGSEADLAAASADGIRAFNLDQGEPFYLGLAVAQGDQKESLPRIVPEWEQALEADLTRAILRVNGAESFAELVETTTQAESAADEEVKRSIANFDSVSVDEAKRILQAQAFKEIKEATAESQSKLENARQRLREAQAAGSEAGQEAAMKELLQAQAAQADELKKISARLQSQINAVERLKGATPPSR